MYCFAIILLVLGKPLAEPSVLDHVQSDTVVAVALGKQIAASTVNTTGQQSDLRVLLQIKALYGTPVLAMRLARIE